MGWAGDLTSTAVAAGRPALRAAVWRRARLAWVLGVGLACVTVFDCYLRQSRTIAVGPDDASPPLQAWDMLHGNPLLHGWWMTGVSFYTTELPQYALIELARGLNTDAVYVAGAMTYTLLVLTAALLARGRARGAGGVTRALIAAGIMLAPQLGPATRALVLSPDHTGASVPILLVFLLIDRAGDRRDRVRWYVPVLVWLGLAWAALGDPITIFVAIIPLTLVCVVRVWHGTVLAKPGKHGEPLTAYRRDVSLTIAAVLAIPAELVITALIRTHGGWQANGPNPALAAGGQLIQNVLLAIKGLLELFGADVFGATTGPGTAIAAVHLLGLALAVAAFLTAASQFLRRDYLIESVLVTGIVIALAAYLAGMHAVNVPSISEIAPVLPFAAVLAGRCLAPPCPARRFWLCVFLALYAGGLGYAAARPPAAPPYAGLAGWLRGHHLTAGLSGYRQASIVTMETGGAVTLRPVTPGANGRLTAYAGTASAAWYNPAAPAATFLVLAAPVKQAIASFGPPAASYRYREYEILVWRPGANLIARLRLTRPAARLDDLWLFEGLWSVHRQFDSRPLVVSLVACRLNGEACPGGSGLIPCDLRTHMNIGDLFDSPWKVLIIAALLIVFFGARKLPDAARSLGKSMRILKSEVSGLHDDEPAQGAPVQAAPSQLQAQAAPIAAPDAQTQIDALSKQLADLQQSVKTSDNAQA
jgi:sec-independent protein translocase protein TatA